MLVFASALLALTSLATASPVIETGPATTPALWKRQTSSAPQVTLRNGTLQGRYEPGFDQDLFYNVPYAAPPVGDLRLANAKPALSWNGTHDSTSWGNACPGFGFLSVPNATLGQNFAVSEDCLNLNIVRPAGAQEGDDLPILFWIHGGGFIQSTANAEYFNGSYLVQRSVEVGQPIIFVSINYRLGVFGFPAGQTASNAGILNLGLKDQRKALHWVQENIAAFGGSPDKVTIWGQSAGGRSVTHQLLAYRGRNEGLFRAAIIDSGIAAHRNGSLERNQAGWENSAGGNTSYAPYPFPDGDFAYQPMLPSIEAGEIVQVPLLIGAMRDEATSGVGAPLGVQNETALYTAVSAGYREVLRSNSNGSLDNLIGLYPGDNEEFGCPFGTGDGAVSTGLQDKRSNAIWTDSYHAGTRLMARKQSWKAPVWSWRFHQVPQNETVDQGVGHSSEIPYLFRILQRTGLSGLGNRPGDLDLSLKMQDYWINFVNHLSPNKGSTPAVYWPTYDKSSQNLIFQNNRTRLEKDDYRKEAIEYQVKLGLGQA
ncbi:hypothetical protein JCM8097_003242 [Rhodosporidiobolus ruineniae]